MQTIALILDLSPEMAFLNDTALWSCTVAHMERTHTFPEMAGSAINADVIMGDELAADVAEEGGNAGRRGKRGRRSNKGLLPAPAAKRKAAALGESLPTVHPLYFPFLSLFPLFKSLS